MVSVPYPGETECGDGWAVMSRPTVLRLLVVDGLGHGVSAAEAARAAVEAFQLGRDDTPTASMARIHDGLRHTRGAAAAVGEVDLSGGVVTFCGVGNIAGLIASGDGERHLVTHNGTVGHDARRMQLFSYPWPKGSMLLLHSDGLTTHWRTGDYPGLLACHPAVAAAVLYRDFRRSRDDATVLVVGPNRHGTHNRAERVVSLPLLSVRVAHESDIVTARQRAHHIAELVGFDSQDQVRIATAVSEIVRNAFRYAGGGRVSFTIEGRSAPQLFSVTVSDEGPGIANLAEVLAGRYHSDTGMGLGIVGSRRLMDRFHIETVPKRGTTVTMGKLLPVSRPPIAARAGGGAGIRARGRRAAVRARRSPAAESRPASDAGRAAPPPGRAASA